ncbi:MAG TPA: preprotein translocase subunit SecG [Chloroflexota bacterium]|nr:preprotein translocase subunit SecG [Chloroflexota bacterium]
MSNSLGIAQIVISVTLIAAILLQAKGSGLGSVFGGDGSVFRTRRGAEKGLFQLTIILAIAFALLSVATAAVAPSVL